MLLLRGATTLIDGFARDRIRVFDAFGTYIRELYVAYFGAGCYRYEGLAL